MMDRQLSPKGSNKTSPYLVLNEFSEETLELPVKRKFLELFMLKEYSSELLEFFDEVEQFRSNQTF